MLDNFVKGFRYNLQKLLFIDLVFFLICILVFKIIIFVLSLGLILVFLIDWFILWRVAFNYKKLVVVKLWFATVIIPFILIFLNICWWIPFKFKYLIIEVSIILTVLSSSTLHLYFDICVHIVLWFRSLFLKLAFFWTVLLVFVQS